MFFPLCSSQHDGWRTSLLLQYLGLFPKRGLQKGLILTNNMIKILPIFILLLDRQFIERKWRMCKVWEIVHRVRPCAANPSSICNILLYFSLGTSMNNSSKAEPNVSLITAGCGPETTAGKKKEYVIGPRFLWEFSIEQISHFIFMVTKYKITQLLLCRLQCNIQIKTSHLSKIMLTSSYKHKIPDESKLYMKKY